MSEPEELGRYRVVVVAKLNGVERFFDLDVCAGRSVNSNAQIASYPIQNAETVSDHMFRQPRTMQLSGTFSLNGRSAFENQNWYTLENITQTQGNIPWDEWFAGEGADLKSLNAENRLESIQTLFEFIQAKGILCKIMLADQNKAGVGRFKVRDNMALQSISWTEKWNSMNFTLGFYEIINVGGLVDFEFFDYDSRYPSPNMPPRKSLGEVMQETGDLPKMIVESLLNAGYIDDKDAKVMIEMLNGGEGDVKIKGVFGENMALIGKWYALAAIVGIVIGVALKIAAIAGAGSIAAGLLASGSLLFPVGTIVAAAAALIIGAIFVIKKCSDNSKKRKRLKEGFNLVIGYANAYDKKGNRIEGVDLTKYNLNATDNAKMVQLMDDIQAVVNQELNNLTFMPLSSVVGDNGPKSFYLQVGNDLLDISIDVNNTVPAIGVGAMKMPVLGNLYSLKLKSYDGSSRIVSLSGDWPVCESLDDFDANKTIIYRDSSRQYELYLYNPSRNQMLYENDESGTSPITQTEDGSSFTIREAALYNELGGYFLVVSKGPVKDAVDNISKVVVKALETQGYTVDD